MRNTNKKNIFFILMIGSILLCLNPSMESAKMSTLSVAALQRCSSKIDYMTVKN